MGAAGVGAAAGAGAGAVAGSHVDPFPYQAPQSPQNAYDPYGHAPQQMHMPDARDYMSSGYPQYGSSGLEGGYGAAAAGAGAGAAAAYGAAGGYGNDPYDPYDRRTSSGSHSSPPMSPGAVGGAGAGAGAGLSAAAIAKQREAQAERNRLRMSTYDGPSGSGQQPTSPDMGAGADGVNRRSSQALSEGRSTVYQHTDMGSVPDDEEEEGLSEIPPG